MRWGGEWGWDSEGDSEGAGTLAEDSAVEVTLVAGDLGKDLPRTGGHADRGEGIGAGGEMENW